MARTIPPRPALAMFAEYHALDKLDAAYRTGDRVLIRNKIRAWWRINQRRLHIG